MKNKIIIAILIVVMLIPSVVAIINYNLESGGEANISNVKSMSLMDPSGNVYNFSYDNGKEDQEMMEYFVTLDDNAEEIADLPTTVESGNYYNLSINTNASEAAYKCYFRTNAQDCYLVDGDGKTYIMAEKDAQFFLESGYSSYLYENGIAPTLNVTGTQLPPSACSWFFTNIKGEYTEAVVATTTEVMPISVEGGFAMDFVTAPDSMTVKMTDKSNGAVIFDDVYDNISGVTIGDEMTVTVEVSAKWYEDNTRNFYGEQTFVFDASLSAPAEFYAGVNTIEIGEFICVTAVNVNDPTGIQFTCEPDIGFTPTFFKQEDGYSYALVPFANDLSAGHYTLTFSYGGTSQNINIDLTSRTNAPFATRSRTFADTSLSTSELIGKAQGTLLPIAQASEAAMLFDGVFEGSDEGLVTGYGHTIQVAGTDIVFEHTGIDLELPAGTEIVAGNTGKVVFADFLDYTGYTVVIDHGLGLKSWYCHMSKTSVNKGDVVEKGTVVGEAGSTGFFNVTGVHIGYTVFDVPVCQYALWADGKYAAAGTPGIPIYKPE